MSIDVTKLQEKLCSILCANIHIMPLKNGIMRVETPFLFSDGDPYQIYIREMPSGILRMTDCGHTLMHMSYENDISKIRDGTRNKIFQDIMSEMDLNEDDGELFMEFNADNLATILFKFGQSLTKISDLNFLNKARVESTFYEDLYESILKTVSADVITKNYVLPELQDAQNYPVDYKIEGKSGNPLFVFGVPCRDKARLATIVLGRFLRQKVNFDSLIVFSDQTLLPRGDLARLTNVGGEMVSSLDAQDDLQRKLVKYARSEPTLN